MPPDTTLAGATCYFKGIDGGDHIMTATALDKISISQCSQLLGWHILDVRPNDGWVRIGFDGKPAFCNPAGLVQGGILCAMLDDTMGPAVFAKTDGRLYTATISTTINYLAPGKAGPMIGEANVIRLGTTVAFVEGRLMDASGLLLATATTNARLVESNKALR
jgi:uncharacterized protein (TIGR00369 family)